MKEQTIYAPSTAIGGAIAVVRVSGADSKTIAKELLSRNIVNTPNRLCYVKLMDGDIVVDVCMAVFMAAPQTYTGEDMLEIHCHGGMQSVQAVLSVLSKTGARPAENGEFSKRAFLNGKMDLSQAEAVMDIINADASQSLKAALLQHEGSVKNKVNAVEELLLDALSGINAAIDYPDEAEEDAYAALPQSLLSAQEQIDGLIIGGREGRILRDGLKIAIIGKPNVGKSSLLNALIGRERAIVTASAGTTRDTIEEKLSLGGYPVRIVDTAGIRQGADEAELIGIDRAKQAMEQADVILLVLDGSKNIDAADTELLSATQSKVRLIVANKSDLPKATADADIYISARTGEGLEQLQKAILKKATPSSIDCSAITNERHLYALEQAATSLAHAQRAGELDCIATDIRDALHHLGRITGTDIDSKTLDLIFQNFCVGK